MAGVSSLLFLASHFPQPDSASTSEARLLMPGQGRGLLGLETGAFAPFSPPAVPKQRCGESDAAAAPVTTATPPPRGSRKRKRSRPSTPVREDSPFGTESPHASTSPNVLAMGRLRIGTPPDKSGLRCEEDVAFADSDEDPNPQPRKRASPPSGRSTPAPPSTPVSPERAGRFPVVHQPVPFRGRVSPGRAVATAVQAPPTADRPRRAIRPPRVTEAPERPPSRSSGRSVRASVRLVSPVAAEPKSVPEADAVVAVAEATSDAESVAEALNAKPLRMRAAKAETKSKRSNKKKPVDDSEEEFVVDEEASGDDDSDDAEEDCDEEEESDIAPEDDDDRPAAKHKGRQRGRRNFPKDSTSLLKRWLDANLARPYPSEQDQTAMAKASGLTVPQIRQWFINARRRTPALGKSKRSRIGDAPQIPFSYIMKQQGDGMDSVRSAGSVGAVV